MKKLRCVVAVALAALLVSPPTVHGGPSGKAGKAGEAGRKRGETTEREKIQGYVLAVEPDRIRVADRWVRLGPGTDVFRRGTRAIDRSLLRPGWEVIVTAIKGPEAGDPAAETIEVVTNPAAKVALTGFLEIEGQGWSDFSAPEVRWRPVETDEDSDENPDSKRRKSAAERDDDFNDLTEHPLSIRGRSIIIDKKTLLLGVRMQEIPPRLLYPGMLIEVHGNTDPKTGRIGVKYLYARYEEPDPVDYQVHQESRFEMIRLKPDLELYTEAALTRWVTRIGESLVPPYATLGFEPPRFRFEVLASEQPVSFSLPDGTIYLSAGMLGLLASDEDLAAVLAHEVAHVSLRQFYRAMSAKQRLSLLDIGTFAGSIALTPLIGILGPMVKSASYRGLHVVPFGMVHGFSSSLELEADAYAMDFLRHAGYDPGALAGLHSHLQTLALPKGRDAVSGTYLFWLDADRWKDRIGPIRHELANRFPASFDYQGQSSPAYLEKIQPVLSMLETRLNGRGDLPPHLRRLSREAETPPGGHS